VIILSSPCLSAFLPNAMETLDSVNDLVYEFLEILGRRISDAFGDSREVSFLFQRLSIIIRRSNAALFHDTLMLHDNPDL